MAYDGDVESFFLTSHDNWQHVQIDLGCVGTLSGLRRYMSRDGMDVSGARTLQGKGASWSLDGSVWTELSGPTTSGWQIYVNYGARLHAWHTVRYGWTAWLHLNSPVQARYVRYLWDGDYDALHEIELQFIPLTEP